MSPPRPQLINYADRDREHNAYKKVQDALGRSLQSLKEADNNFNKDEPFESCKDCFKHISDAREYCLEEIRLRRAFNGRWYGGAHARILEQIKLREDLATNKLTPQIEILRALIAQLPDPHAPGIPPEEVANKEWSEVLSRQLSHEIECRKRALDVLERWETSSDVDIADEIEDDIAKVDSRAF